MLVSLSISLWPSASLTEDETHGILYLQQELVPGCNLLFEALLMHTDFPTPDFGKYHPCTVPF